MKIHTRALALLIALVSSSLLQAQVAEKKPASTEKPKIDLVTMDKDGNGTISRKEAEELAELGAAFNRLDTDGNNKLSAAEFSHWSRAGNVAPGPHDPTTVPSGSAGSQHMPAPD